jgi:hypothetical protein
MGRDKSIKVNPVLESLAKGLAIGGGAAAVSALASQILEAKRQKKLKEEHDKKEISPNTIVLRIKKKAECKKKKKTGCGGECKKKKVKVLPSVEEKDLNNSGFGHTRDMNGRFSSITTKEAQEFKSIPGEATGILAFGGGTLGGYYLINKLAKKLEKKRLEKQIEAAQQEYIDLLDGKIVKGAEAFSDLFMFGNTEFEDLETSVATDMQKSAGVPSDVFNLITKGPRNLINSSKHISSALLASYILGIGSSAYVAKKLLENHFDADNEEEPEKETRIILKTASSEFEIQPEEMLATIGIMKDCISDSLPPGVKIAAGTDYSVLDEISKRKGGKQWILDQYSSMNGLPTRKSTFMFENLPLFIKNKKTLFDIKNNPKNHSAGIKSYVMGMMQKDPESWFKLLGNKYNNGIVRMKAEEQINNFGKNGGILGFLSKIPFLGKLIKSFSKWYTQNSSWGKKMVARKTLKQMGVVGDRAKNIISKYDFSNGSGWSEKVPNTLNASVGMYNPQGIKNGINPSIKTAQSRDILTSLLKGRAASDITNRELLKRVDKVVSRLENNTGKGKSKPKDNEEKKNSLFIKFDDELAASLSEKDKKKILDALNNIG